MRLIKNVESRNKENIFFYHNTWRDSKPKWPISPLKYFISPPVSGVISVITLYDRKSDFQTLLVQKYRLDMNFEKFVFQPVTLIIIRGQRNNTRNRRRNKTFLVVRLDILVSNDSTRISPDIAIGKNIFLVARFDIFG